RNSLLPSGWRSAFAGVDKLRFREYNDWSAVKADTYRKDGSFEENTMRCGCGAAASGDSRFGVVRFCSDRSG
ncbi:MAG: hypothetical protein ACI4Q4_01060, partial [Oscillospiraceae bacterium]